MLERLGSTGNAKFDWRLALAEDWEESRSYLRQVPGTADTVINPDGAGRLSVVADLASRHMAIDDDEPQGPPLPLSEEDVAVLRPDWHAIAAELGTRLGFVPANWESEGVTRRIGTLQGRGEHPRPVILHLPAGTFGDRVRLHSDLAEHQNAIVLLPSAARLCPKLQKIGRRNQLEIFTLAELFESDEPVFPLAAVSSPSKSSTKRRKPILHPKPGWTWAMVRIQVTTTGRLILTCDGQRKEFAFPKTKQRIHSPGYAIMMHVAVRQEWRNPPAKASDHDRVRKQFQRLEKLLMDLVPLPELPFRRTREGFEPVFRVSLDGGLAERGPDGR